MKALFFSLLVIVSNLKTQNIYSYAGNGMAGSSGDGGLAITANLSYPSGVAADSMGNIYIADQFNNRIRKINSSGIISTIAGNGIGGFSGDGSAAILAQLHGPTGVAIDKSGNIYVADYNNNRIRKINNLGIITSIAGNGILGFSGDSGLATAAKINGPYGVAVDTFGNIFVADYWNNRIRKINSSGIITTAAGGGTVYPLTGGTATLTFVDRPSGIATDISGNFYFSVTNSENGILRVNPAGILTRMHGGKAYGIATDITGNVYCADKSENLIKKVVSFSLSTTIAGTGTSGFSGDGGPAVAAEINNPSGVAVDRFGNIYIADYNNNKIRVVCVNNCNLAGVSYLSNLYDKISIFPNPCSGLFYVKIEDEIANGEMELTNLFGEKVYSQSVRQGINRIELSFFPKGIFQYTMYKNKQPFSYGKIIID
jgi:sugar lactone lactonase YvrE